MRPAVQPWSTASRSRSKRRSAILSAPPWQSLATCSRTVLCSDPHAPRLDHPPPTSSPPHHHQRHSRDPILCAQKATRMLEEAMASEGGLAVQGRTEAEDSAAVHKERRKAVSTGSKPRRPRAPRAPRGPRGPRAQKSQKAQKTGGGSGGGGGGSSGGGKGGRKIKSLSRSTGQGTVDGGGVVAPGDAPPLPGAIEVLKGKGKGKAVGRGDGEEAAAAGAGPDELEDDDDDFIDDSGLAPEPGSVPQAVSPPPPLPQALSSTVAGLRREDGGTSPSLTAAESPAAAPRSGEEARRQDASQQAERGLPGDHQSSGGELPGEYMTQSPLSSDMLAYSSSNGSENDFGGDGDGNGAENAGAARATGDTKGAGDDSGGGRAANEKGSSGGAPGADAAVVPGVVADDGGAGAAEVGLSGIGDGASTEETLTASTPEPSAPSQSSSTGTETTGPLTSRGEREGKGPSPCPEEQGGSSGGCEPEVLAAMLMGMGVVDDAIVSDEGLPALKALLQEAGGKADLAVELFFGRESDPEAELLVEQEGTKKVRVAAPVLVPVAIFGSAASCCLCIARDCW